MIGLELHSHSTWMTGEYYRTDGGQFGHAAYASLAICDHPQLKITRMTVEHSTNAPRLTLFQKEWRSILPAGR
jgi:hypothetical protein